MPKLPVITAPSVAPQPINLPGPRKTYAGEGLTALGGALMQGAATVDKVLDAKDAEAERLRKQVTADDLARREQELVAWQIRKRVDPETGYRAWRGKDGSLGVEGVVSDEFQKEIDRVGQGVSPESARDWANIVLKHKNAVTNEVGQYELDQVGKEHRDLLGATIATTSADASSFALKLNPAEDDPSRTISAMGSLADRAGAVRLYAVTLAKEAKASPERAEQLKRDILTAHHVDVADNLLKNSNVSLDFVRAYLNSNAADLDERSDKLGSLRGRLDVAQVDFDARDQRAKANGNAAQAAANVKAAAEQGLKDPKSPFADPRMQAHATKVIAKLTALSDDDEVTWARQERPATALVLAEITKEWIRTRQVPMTVEDAVNLARRGGARVPPELRSAASQERIMAAISDKVMLGEAKARQEAKDLDGLTGDTAKSVWGFYKNESSAVRAELSDPSNPVYASVSTRDGFLLRQFGAKAKGEVESGYGELREIVLKDAVDMAEATKSKFTPSQLEGFKAAAAEAFGRIQAENTGKGGRPKPLTVEQMTEVVSHGWKRVVRDGLLFDTSRVHALAPEIEPNPADPEVDKFFTQLRMAPPRVRAEGILQRAAGLRRLLTGSGQFVAVNALTGEYGPRIKDAAEAAKLRAAGWIVLGGN